MEKFMTIPEAVEYLAARGLVIKPLTLKQHCYRGTIEASNSNPVKPSRGEWLIAQSVLDTWKPAPQGRAKGV